MPTGGDNVQDELGEDGMVLRSKKVINVNVQGSVGDGSIATSPVSTQGGAARLPLTSTSTPGYNDTLTNMQGVRPRVAIQENMGTPTGPYTAQRPPPPRYPPPMNNFPPNTNYGPNTGVTSVVFDEDAAMNKYVRMGTNMGLKDTALAQFVTDRTDTARQLWSQERQRQEDLHRHEQHRREDLYRQEQHRQEEIRRQENQRQEEMKIRREEMKIWQAQIEQQKSQLDSSISQMMASNTSEKDDYKLILPRLRDDDDIDFFLLHFENISSPRNWSDFKKVSRLVPLLSGKALKAYNELLKGNTNPSYREVKQAILEEYRLTSEHYRRQFRTVTKNVDENFKQFCRRQQLMFDRWFEVAEVDRSEPEEIIRVILLEQMMATLHGDLALHVKEKLPSSAKEAAEFAFLHLEARKEVELDRKARSTQLGQKPQKGQNSKLDSRGSNKDEELGKSGGSSLQALQNKKGSETQGGDRNAGSTGSKRKMTPEEAKLFKEGRCFKCKEKGHFSKKCPKFVRGIQTASNSKQGHGDSKEAQQTREKGRDPLWEHLQPLCGECENIEWRRDLKVRVDGKVVNAMRDTGADDLCIRPEHVNESNYLGTFEKITLADLKIQGSYPRAVVELDSPFIKGKVQCVVIDDLGVDVFIGDSLKFSDGTLVDNVPVYPRRNLLAITRAQAKKNQNTHQPIHVPEVDGLHVTPDELKKLQENDETLNKCHEAAKTGKKLSRGGNVTFVKTKGILKRVFTDEKGKHTQVCVPKSLRQSVLKLGHDSAMSGHMGTKKTRERIWNSFYWPRMCQDIMRYCVSCDRCQKITPKGRVSKVPLGKMVIPHVPFEQVAVDLIGPIKPASEKGFRYVVVMVDYATRYPEATPLKSIEASQVAEALWVMFSRVGVPRKMVTDRGSQFTGECMAELRKLLSIKGNMTTPYHAQANGLVERFNGTLKSMLRKLAGEQPKEWDKYIPALLFAYREVPQASTGYSPFELLYGRTIRGPLAILKDLWTSEEEREPEVQHSSQYVLELRNRIEETCKIAQQQLERESVKYKRYFDKKTKPRVFPVGSRVLLLLPHKLNKLEMSWRGPFIVEQRVGDCDYQINVAGKTKLFHANMLKAYVERTPHLNAVAVIPHESDEWQETETIKEDIPLIPLQQKEDASMVKYGDASPELLNSLREKVAEHPRIMTDLPLRTNLDRATLPLESEKPVRRKQYPLPYVKRDSIGNEVETMLKMGVVTRSTSAYSSPIVLVEKSDGTYRFCTDFRELNKLLKFDAEPMPDVDFMFSKISQAKIYSKIDLCKGYWQIEIAPEDRHKTAFSTPQGCFEWTVMPFGLKTAGAIFSRMMRKLISPLNLPEIDNFIDDIIIGTETEERHLECVDKLLKRLDEANIAARPTKCSLGFTQIEYLGHQIGKGVLKPLSDKLEKIRDTPRPTTKKMIRAFLGLAGFYRKFVPRFSEIAVPLTNATKKNAPNTVVWTEEMNGAFIKLKDALSTKPVCVLPDMKKPFVLRTDASDGGLGALLLQEVEGDLKIVACASKKLKGAELNYSVIEKECFAIVWGIKRFDPYLMGRPFVVQSDHQPLEFLQGMKASNKRLMRWAMALQPYNITIQAIPGAENCGADFLSRIE